MVIGGSRVYRGDLLVFMRHGAFDRARHYYHRGELRIAIGGGAIDEKVLCRYGNHSLNLEASTVNHTVPHVQGARRRVWIQHSR